MSERNWIFTDKFFEEDILKSYLSQSKVSVNQIEAIVKGARNCKTSADFIFR